MAESALVHQFRTELRDWIAHRSRAGAAAFSPPSDDIMERRLAVLVETYRAITLVIGLPPTPDLLIRCGEPGAMIHSVCCQTRGTWAAFRTVVAQHHPEIVHPTPLDEDGEELDSFPERLVLRALRSLSGVTSIVVHPVLPGGTGRRADFLVKAATGREVFVEVAMVGSSPIADSDLYRAYRGRLTEKLATYTKLGQRPVVIWSDDLAPPRVLAARMDEVLGALDLPSRPPQRPAWFEAASSEGPA